MNLKIHRIENKCAAAPESNAAFAQIAAAVHRAAIWISFLVIMILMPTAVCFAAPVDYQSLQENPIETAYRILISPGEVEWDEGEMTTGGAPGLISNMKWPLKTGELAGGFYRTRAKGHRRHSGIDLVAPNGTPIYAVLDGVVEVVSNGGNGFRGYGKVIIINHSGQLWSLYSHCATMKARVGQNVNQGQVIATVGSTGRATTNHLHFEIRNSKGMPLDPIKYMPRDGALTTKLYRR